MTKKFDFDIKVTQDKKDSTKLNISYKIPFIMWLRIQLRNLFMRYKNEK